MELVIVTGLSGAGKSRAIAVLEDMGFYCVDNMPVSMIPKFAEICSATKGRYENTAIVVDSRTIDSYAEFQIVVDDMQKNGLRFTILFLEASTPVLIKRYKETRRKHPLADQNLTTEDAIEKERELLADIRLSADYVIDTSSTTTADLRSYLVKLYDRNKPCNGLRVRIISFGYKYGIPMEADMVFDLRCLPNPFYIEDLKSLTGMDDAVADYVMSFEQSRKYYRKIVEMTDFLLPLFVEEGKSSVVIAVGCTGGQHRSVAIAEILNRHIAGQKWDCRVIHRDMEKNKKTLI